MHNKNYHGLFPSKHGKKIAFLIIFFFLTFYIVLPVVFCFAVASTEIKSNVETIDGGKIKYTPLEKDAIDTALAGSGKDATSNLSSFLKYGYNFGVAAAVVLAVVMIAWGGIEYMTTEAFTGKQGGKDKITSALWGLLLVFASYLILYTVNPDILLTPAFLK